MTPRELMEWCVACIDAPEKWHDRDAMSTVGKRTATREERTNPHAPVYGYVVLEGDTYCITVQRLKP